MQRKSKMEEPKIVEYALSTADNPYNPFTQFDEWYAFDEGKGYHSSEYLARIAEDNTGLSEKEQILAKNLAIEEILQYNLTGNYIKVKEDDVIHVVS